MRLIDADELWKHKFKSASERMDLEVAYMGGWNDAIDSIVENAPTVDAEPVVRCKDCKWWNSNEETCIEIGGLWRSLDFCSWGERREDETN